MSEANDWLTGSDYQLGYRLLEQQLQGVLENLSGSQNWNLQPVVLSLKQMYQTQLLSLNLDSLPPETHQMLQSIQVEIDKHLRLLTIDAQQLQVARQAETIDQRKKQIRDRLQTLLRYCTLVLKDAGDGSAD